MDNHTTYHTDNHTTYHMVKTGFGRTPMFPQLGRSLKNTLIEDVCVPFIINQTPAVCVFRLLSTKLQPPGGTIVTAPSGLRTRRVCGQSLRPSLAPNHFW